MHLAESEESTFSLSEHMSAFSETAAGSCYAGPSGPVTETGRFLLRSTFTDNRFLLLPIHCGYVANWKLGTALLLPLLNTWP